MGGGGGENQRLQAAMIELNPEEINSTRLKTKLARGKKENFEIEN